MQSTGQVFPFVLLLAGAAGCAEVLGLEEWQDPAGGGGAGASDMDAGTASDASASGAGGVGGSSVNGPNCTDGYSNGDETDIDCGGDACKPCDDTQKCLAVRDCKSNNCSPNGTCVPAGEDGCYDVEPDNPTCRDCTKNGLETDFDCGGEEPCPPCRVARGCAVDGDCLSSKCVDFKCAPGEANAACQSGADCASGACGPGECTFGKCCK